MTPAQQREELRQWIASGQARAWRVAAGLNQAEAAAEVGVHVSTFCRWEAVGRTDHPREPQRLAGMKYHERLKVWRRLATRTDGQP